jgi:hypothetical protein
VGRVIGLATKRRPEAEPAADDKVRCASCRRALASVRHVGSFLVVIVPCACGCQGALLVKP